MCHVYEQGIHPSELPMTAFTAVCHPNYQNLQKVGYDTVIFNGNVRSCVTYMIQEGYQNGSEIKKLARFKQTLKMSFSLLIGHTQIFKSIDFRTMGF